MLHQSGVKQAPQWDHLTAGRLGICRLNSKATVKHKHYMSRGPSRHGPSDILSFQMSLLENPDPDIVDNLQLPLG